MLTRTSITLLHSFILQLHTVFLFKDMGALNYFLGIQVTRTPQSLFLRLSKYIHALLG